MIEAKLYMNGHWMVPCKLAFSYVDPKSNMTTTTVCNIDIDGKWIQMVEPKLHVHVYRNEPYFRNTAWPVISKLYRNKTYFRVAAWTPIPKLYRNEPYFRVTTWPFILKLYRNKPYFWVTTWPVILKLYRNESYFRVLLDQ